jgi:hypothetical protein
MECQEAGHRFSRVISDHNGHAIHYKYGSAGSSEAAQDRANARLIATAPTMATALDAAEAALSGVLEAMPNLPTVEAVRDQCRAVLAQARGETP